MIQYIAFLAVTFLATVFPLKPLYWMAARISDVYHFFDTTRRKAVAANLRVITGGALDEKAIKKAVRKTYLNFGLYLAEFFRTSKLDKEYFDSHVALTGTEYVDEALKLGKGVVIVSAHLGNWEMGIHYFCTKGYPAYVIMGTHKNKRVNDLFLKPRVKAGARPISTWNAIEEGHRALGENGILIVAGDRVTTKGGVKRNFFGRLATFPKGPAKFALGAGAPIIPAFIMRHPGNTFSLTFEEPIFTGDLPDTDESVGILMDRYIGWFEEYIRRDPTQFTVFYEVWKDGDDAAVASD
jgi:KDO2-lipid IV(A) lauroyltransferase